MVVTLYGPYMDRARPVAELDRRLVRHPVERPTARGMCESRRAGSLSITAAIAGRSGRRWLISFILRPRLAPEPGPRAPDTNLTSVLHLLAQVVDSAPEAVDVPATGGAVRVGRGPAVLFCRHVGPRQTCQRGIQGCGSEVVIHNCGGRADRRSRRPGPGRATTDVGSSCPDARGLRVAGDPGVVGVAGVSMPTAAGIRGHRGPWW